MGAASLDLAQNYVIVIVMCYTLAATINLTLQPCFKNENVLKI